MRFVIGKNGCTKALNNQQQISQLINGNQMIISKSNDDSDDINVVRAELVQVRKVLDRERKLRMKLEEQVRDLDSQLYPTRIKEIVQQIQTTGVSFYKLYCNLLFIFNLPFLFFYLG